MNTDCKVEANFIQKQNERTDKKYVVKSDSGPLSERVLKDLDFLGLPFGVFKRRRGFVAKGIEQVVLF